MSRRELSFNFFDALLKAVHLASQVQVIYVTSKLFESDVDIFKSFVE